MARSYEEITFHNIEIKAKIGEITDKKIKLEKSERRFRTLLDNYPEGIIINHKDRICFINIKAVTILGYDKSQELEGIPILNIIHPDRRENFSQKFIDLNTSNQSFEYGVFLKKNNTEISVEITGFSIMIDKTKSDVIIFRDISEDFKRTISIEQARKKLDVLSSITRHDIRNQVHILISTLDLLSDEKISELGVTLLHKAFVPCNNILDSLKTNGEYQVIGIQQPCWFSVKTLAENAIHYHQITDDMYSISGDNVDIFADQMINKVFENLIDNSIRHGENFKKIFFKTEITSTECLVVYSDCGVGIPDKEKEMVFIKGYGKNTGQGLYLIREILSITGITIRESGKFGEGVRFEITIPSGKWKTY